MTTASSSSNLKIGVTYGCYSFAFKPALSMAVGCMAGTLVKSPVLISGGVFAISTFVGSLVTFGVGFIGGKCGAKLSTINKIASCASLLIDLAFLAAAVALGVFGWPVAVFLLCWALIGYATSHLITNFMQKNEANEARIEKEHLAAEAAQDMRL